MTHNLAMVHSQIP